MDYQSKIIIDATKALKDLTALSKVLQSNDKHVNALNKSSDALNKTLKSNTSTTSKLTTQTKYLNAVLKKSVANSGKLATQTKYLNTSMKNSVANMKKLTTQTRLLNIATKSNTSSILKLNKAMSLNNTALKANSASLTKVTSTMATLATATAKSVASMKMLSAQTKSLNSNIAKNSVNLKSLQTTMTALGGVTNKAAMALANFSRNSATLNASLTANTAALNRLTKQMMTLGISVNANTAALARYGTVSKTTAASQVQLGHSMDFVNKFLKIQLVLFRTAMLAATAYASVKLYIEFNKTAESVDLLGRKLETFTGNAEALNIITAASMKTGFAIQDLGKIVTRFAITTEGAFSTATLTKWTEGLVMSARAAGTSTMEMNNALIQLSQSFSAGFLMGDEYRSISENLPLFKLALRDVADEAGMAGQSLKELSSGRKIDIDLMTTALEKLSKESMKYTFALDNIEAAEQRVKVGWELWANSVAESRALKDSLNFLAGSLATIANNGAAMNAFAEGFPEMSRDVESFVDVIMDLYDTSGLVYDLWAEFFSFMSMPGDEALRLQIISESMNMIYDGLNELPINIQTIMSIIGVKIARSVEEWSLTFDILGVYWNKVMDYLSSSLDHTAADIKSAFLGIFDDIFETIAKKLSTISTLLSNFETTSAMAQSFKDSADSLSGIIDKQKTFNQIEEEQRKIYSEKTEASDKELAAINKKIEAGKRLSNQMVGEILLKDAERKAEFKHNQKMNSEFRLAIREDAKNQARITPEKDKGRTKREVIDKKAITAYKNAVKDAIRDLEKFAEVQRDVNREINELKNPFSTKIDASSEIEDMEEQIERLNNARKVNEISEKNYAKAVTETIELTKELIDLKQDEHLEELARGYDEVATAQYEYNKTQSELNDLVEAGKISEDAYTKAIYEKVRALKVAQAKSGEMNEGDQFFQGMNDGLYDFANNNKTVFEEMSELTTKSFSSMTDELTEFVTTGKADFKGLVDSIVKDLTRIAIQKSITEPLAGALFGGSSSGGGGLGGIAGSLLGGLGGIGTAMSLGTNIGSQQTAMLAAQWANGGVFSQGNVQAFASGGIVNSPTIFPMADGMGLMGEAGSEAIMPLKRGKDGKLGVASTGENTNITININVSGTEGNPEAIRRSAGQVAQAAGNATQRAMRRNG